MSASPEWQAILTSLAVAARAVAFALPLAIALALLLMRKFPGRMLLDDEVPNWVRRELVQRGYKLEFKSRTAGPINAIMVDHAHGTLWGASGNHGEDYGIGW